MNKIFSNKLKNIIQNTYLFNKSKDYLNDLDLLLFAGKKRLFILFFVMICAAFLEAASTYVIAPLIETVGKLSNQDSTIDSSFFVITLIAIVITILNAFMRIYNLKKVTFFSAYLANNIFYKALWKSLNDNFDESSKENTSDISSVLSNQLNATSGGLQNYMLLISTLVVIIFQLGAVIYIGGFQALFLILLCVIAYISVYIYNRKSLIKNSIDYERSTRLLMQQIVDSLKLKYEYRRRNIDEKILNFARKTDFKGRKSQASTIYLTAAPRFTVEAFIISGICLVIFIAGFDSIETNYKLFAKLGVIALSSQKILPSLQSLYKSLAVIKGTQESIRAIKEQLKNVNKIKTKKNIRQHEKINLLTFKNIFFKYKNSKKNVFEGLSLNIELNGINVIRGKSGCGKTTLLRMICGEIYPDNGVIKSFSNKELIKGLYGYDYLPTISYVPQKIYLLDNSLENNITLDNESMDRKKLENILKICCLEDFLDNYRSKTFGQDGSQLSGGQIQRVGIARGLWIKSDILILDEATNALDAFTEKILLDNLINSSYVKSIIMIKHGDVNTNKQINYIYL